MKRILFSILAMVMLLTSLASCASSSLAVSETATAEQETVTEEKKTEKEKRDPTGFAAGYSRAVINPTGAVGMGGYGNTEFRRSTGVASDITASCTAVSDGENTALFFCIDVLGMGTKNVDSIYAQVEKALAEGGIEAAKEVCRNKRGPIASIFYQGLDRYHLGLDAVEKAVVSYGSVQTGRLESGLGWLSLFISLSPSLGFMGTVVGLVQSFDSIQAAGDISPALVAGGMKVALLTTLLGLIAAMVLQVFYNYVIVKIDGMVNEMEDASITLTDILTAYSKK